MNWEPLLAAATAARSHSHSPYSRFAVGAAVATVDGAIFAGARCREPELRRHPVRQTLAFAAAVSAGHRQFRGVAILTDSSPPSAPCGVCRETMTEFCDPAMPILLANPQGDAR